MTRDIKLPGEILQALMHNEANSVTEPLLKRAVSHIADLETECVRYMKALEEIRDVAAVSDGVGFYKMLADKALDGEVDRALGGADDRPN